MWLLQGLFLLVCAVVLFYYCRSRWADEWIDDGVCECEDCR